LLTLSELGISIIPAMPGFYGGQKTFDDLINFVVQKVLNHLTIDYNISKKWRD
jgi:4-hydroxy-3-polyprenylbenzoate decarboxylase